MKINHIAFLILLFPLSCSAPGSRSYNSGRSLNSNGDFFNDMYSTSSRTYINPDQGFSLQFNPTWDVYPHYNTMPDEMKSFATKIRQQGAEVLLFARHPRNYYWLRTTVEVTNLPLDEYFHLIRNINKGELNRDSFTPVQISGYNMIQWDMWTQKSGVTLHFREYQAKVGPNNIRFTFWTVEPLFDLYQKKFLEIISTFRELNPEKPPMPAGTITTFRFRDCTGPLIQELSI